jgi:hypothetical protein
MGPIDTIKPTLAVTTQYARVRVSDKIRQHWKSRFPACNVKRCNEAVATDTVFIDTPAVVTGSINAAQIDTLAFKLLTPCNQAIFRSDIWSALDPTLSHKRLIPLDGKNDANHADDKLFVCSKKLSSSDPTILWRMPTIDPKDLIGRTFLKVTKADGQQFHAWIVSAIIEKHSEMKRDPDHVKISCKVDGDTADDIYTYNQVNDFIERDSLDIESDS